MGNNENLRSSSSEGQADLTAESARSMIEERGEVVDKVEQFPHAIDGKRVLCFSVHLSAGQPGYIIRSDTRQVYGAAEFWGLFSDFDQTGFPKI